MTTTYTTSSTVPMISRAVSFALKVAQFGLWAVACSLSLLQSLSTRSKIQLHNVSLPANNEDLIKETYRHILRSISDNVACLTVILPLKGSVVDGGNTKLTPSHRDKNRKDQTTDPLSPAIDGDSGMNKSQHMNQVIESVKRFPPHYFEAAKKSLVNGSNGSLVMGSNGSPAPSAAAAAVNKDEASISQEKFGPSALIRRKNISVSMPSLTPNHMMFPKKEAPSLRKVQSCDTFRSSNSSRRVSTERNSVTSRDSSRSHSSSPGVGDDVFPVIEISSPSRDGDCATRFLLIEGSGSNYRREEVLSYTPRRQYDYATIPAAVAITSA